MMPISPAQANATLTTAQEYADWLVIQIDAWLTSQWKDPSETCYHVPSYLKSHAQYSTILALVLQQYRPLWPHIHTFSTPNYTCDFMAFVTEPCDSVHVA